MPKLQCQGPVDLNAWHAGMRCARICLSQHNAHLLQHPTSAVRMQLYSRIAHSGCATSYKSQLCCHPLSAKCCLALTAVCSGFLHSLSAIPVSCQKRHMQESFHSLYTLSSCSCLLPPADRLLVPFELIRDSHYSIPSHFIIRMQVSVGAVRAPQPLQIVLQPRILRHHLAPGHVSALPGTCTAVQVNADAYSAFVLGWPRRPLTSPKSQARQETGLATRPFDLHENSRRETHAAPQPSCREAATCYMQCVTTLEDEDVRAKLKGSRSAHHRGSAHARLSRRSRRRASRCRWCPPRGGAPRAPPPRTAASAARRPPRQLHWVAANPTRVSDVAGVPWLHALQAFSRIKQGQTSTKPVLHKARTSR